MADTLTATEVIKLTESLEADLPCECMVCDLPRNFAHGPIEWRVTVDFPGPYPLPRDAIMLLSDNCMRDWTSGEWPPPHNNFSIVSCLRV